MVAAMVHCERRLDVLRKVFLGVLGASIVLLFGVLCLYAQMKGYS